MALDPITIDELRRRNDESQQQREAEKAAEAKK